MAKPKTGVQSGMVRTVLGPIPVDAMGVTLMHEHTLLDTSSSVSYTHLDVYKRQSRSADALTALTPQPKCPSCPIAPGARLALLLKHSAPRVFKLPRCGG